jgi:hypothetical protein
VEVRFSVTIQTHPRAHPTFSKNGYQFFFLQVKQTGCGTDHPTPSTAKGKERVELYLYSPYEPLWPVLG